MRTLNIDYLNTDRINANYILIEAVQQMNVLTFWRKIWQEKVSSIVMIYAIDESVRREGDFHVIEELFLLIEFVCSILAE